MALTTLRQALKCRGPRANSPLEVKHPNRHLTGMWLTVSGTATSRRWTTTCWRQRVNLPDKGGHGNTITLLWKASARNPVLRAPRLSLGEASLRVLRCVDVFASACLGSFILAIECEWRVTCYSRHTLLHWTWQYSVIRALHSRCHYGAMGSHGNWDRTTRASVTCCTWSCLISRS